MSLLKQTEFNQPWQKILFLFVLLLCIIGAGQPLPAAATDQESALSKDGHLRTRPDAKSKVTYLVRKGTKVIQRGQQPGWAHVVVPSIKRSGWIPDNLLCAQLSIPILQPQKLKKSLQKNSSSQPKGEQTPSLTSKLRKQPTSYIAVLDVQKIIDNSQRGKKALLDYKKLSTKKSPEELAQTEQEVLTRIVMEIRMLVEIYAAEHHWTHIINKNSASLFIYDPRFDITDEILQLYDKQAGRQQ